MLRFSFHFILQYGLLNFFHYYTVTMSINGKKLRKIGAVPVKSVRFATVLGTELANNPPHETIHIAVLRLRKTCSK